MRRPGGPVRARPARARRATGRRWAPWLPVVGVVLVLALVALTGGFREAEAVGPRRFAVGEVVELRRWVVAVRDVQLVDTTSYGSPAPATLRVDLDVTWTGDATTEVLPKGLVTLVVPGGPAPSEDVSTASSGVYTGGFDPDVTRPVRLEAVWPAGAGPDDPRRPAPATVQVVLSDERPAQNFLYADQWVTTSPLGHVAVAPSDVRTR